MAEEKLERAERCDKWTIVQLNFLRHRDSGVDPDRLVDKMC